jgi:hypothetical protein
MKFSWILIHMQGNATTMQQDEHGFWVVNHEQCVNANLELDVLSTIDALPSSLINSK